MLGWSATGVPWFCMATEDLYALAGLDAPLDALHASRLRYLKRAIGVAPPVLWQLLWQTSSPNSWMANLWRSFQWFGQHYPHMAKEAPSDLQGWITMVAVDAGWKGRVRTALKACRQFRIRQAEGKKWSLSVVGSLREMGGISDESEMLPIPHPQGWRCGLCQQVFSTKRALAMHASQMHNYKPEGKYYVLGPDCLACGKRYFSRNRSLRHFQTSLKCASILQACFAPAREETVELADGADREYAQALSKQGWNPMKAFRPPLQMPWVSLPPCNSTAAQKMRAKWEVRNGNEQKGYQVAVQWQHMQVDSDGVSQPSHRVGILRRLNGPMCLILMVAPMKDVTTSFSRKAPLFNPWHRASQQGSSSIFSVDIAELVTFSIRLKVMKFESIFMSFASPLTFVWPKSFPT